MLIAEYDETAGEVKTILDIQRVPRLGKGVDSNRNILPESIQKAIEIHNHRRQHHGSSFERRAIQVSHQLHPLQQQWEGS